MLKKVLEDRILYSDFSKNTSHWIKISADGLKDSSTKIDFV